MAEREYEAVIDFWFGELDAEGRAPPERSARWWAKSDAFDAEVRERFEALFGSVLRGERDEWVGTARGRLAQILVLDQFSRNMFRGTPRMYEGDTRAQRLVEEGLAMGHDAELPLTLRVFFYMPLMHAESLAVQKRSVALFRELADGAAEEERQRTAQNLDFAERHRDIVARFGRFPHRNEILGRPSTDEELAFLEQPGSSF